MNTNETKHTPGPWMFDVSHGVIHGVPCYIDSPKGYSGNSWNEVCSVRDFFNYDTRKYLHEKTLANARLIAAAPDLLEALNRYVELYEMDDKDRENEHMNYWFECEDEARKALALVSGEEKPI